jgi:hypothetical protein
MGAASAQPAARRATRFGWRRTGAFAAAVVGVALAAGACGGGGGSKAAVAHVGKGTPTTAATAGTQAGAYGPNYQRGLKYTQCMRKNGEPSFPEPNSQGDFLFKANGGDNHSSGVNPNSPAFQAAERACKALAPPTPTASQAETSLAQALKYAQCMRKNGVLNFPDPKVGPGGTIEMLIGAASGINPNSPQFQKAMQACHSLAPTGGP